MTALPPAQSDPAFAPKSLESRVVGGIEGFERQFRQRQINRGSKNGDGAEEGKNACVRPQPQGNRHLVVTRRFLARGGSPAAAFGEWTPAASYADPVVRAEGLTAINDMIAGVQGQFPAFRFALMGDPSGHGEFVRFRWKFGPDGAEPPVEGSDVLVIDGGKISRVIGFLDKFPQ